MKRFGKKMVSMVISTALLTTMFSMSTLAAETIGRDTADAMSQAEVRDEIVEIVKNADSTYERDKQLSRLLQSNPLEATSNVKTVESVSMVETVEIDDTLRVDFYSNGEFGIQELEKVGTSFGNAFATRGIGNGTTFGTAQANTRATAWYTDTYRAHYTIKNNLGLKIVETYVKGYFLYDKTNTPAAYLTDAGYSKGALIMWDCASWDDGTATNTRDKVAYCYADAYYHWSIGAEVTGGSDNGGGSVSGGITLQDANVFLKLNCDKSGNVYSTVSIED